MLYSPYKYITLGLFHTDIYYRIRYPLEYVWQNSPSAIYKKSLGGDMFFHGFLHTVNGDNIKSTA